MRLLSFLEPGLEFCSILFELCFYYLTIDECLMTESSWSLTKKSKVFFGALGNFHFLTAFSLEVVPRLGQV